MSDGLSSTLKKLRLSGLAESLEIRLHVTVHHNHSVQALHTGSV